MYKKRLLKTLKILKKAALTTAEFIDIFPQTRLTINKAFNTKPIWEIIFGDGGDESEKQINSVATKISRAKRERHNYYQLLHCLSKQKLIQKIHNSKWLPTIQGLKKLEILEKDPILKLSRHYPREISPELKIIIFDIPEKERWKRGWLRSVLQNLGFRMLQKSVWIGKNNIPGELLRDLRMLGLLSYVEIFAVTKTGSLKVKKLV